MQKVICPNPCIDFPQCKDRIPHLPDNDWCQRPCDIVEVRDGNGWYHFAQTVGKCIPIPESDEDIRKSERMKIGSWLENETRGVNFGAWAYWWNSVIAKLKSGQKSEG